MRPSGSSRTEPASDVGLQEFASDVRAGLAKSPQKELHSKYLYDELGTALFEAITHLPEYGLTRADTRLLTAHSGDIAKSFPGPVAVAEFGSGSGQKSRIILEAFDGRAPFYPIDISADALTACEAALDGVAAVHPICGTYLEGLARVNSRRREQERLSRNIAHNGARRRGERSFSSEEGPRGPCALLLLFLGSTIGNFEPNCAREFLAEVRDRMEPGDGFLVGADLVKPVARLLSAYDDGAGVTAAFDRNLLGRINRELGGNFDLRAFEHDARWDPSHNRIEMHLRSVRNQKVSIPGAACTVHFTKGETIWTESSHKFEPAQLLHMAAEAGFEVRVTWIDDEWPFAESLWIAA